MVHCNFVFSFPTFFWISHSSREYLAHIGTEDSQIWFCPRSTGREWDHDSLMGVRTFSASSPGLGGGVIPNPGGAGAGRRRCPGLVRRSRPDRAPLLDIAIASFFCYNCAGVPPRPTGRGYIHVVERGYHLSQRAWITFTLTSVVIIQASKHGGHPCRKHLVIIHATGTKPPAAVSV